MRAGSNRIAQQACRTPLLEVDPLGAELGCTMLVRALVRAGRGFRRARG
ncbi:hypothetical protein [Haloechinothrix sp. LS1_15]|nr:hypothetical protein [Haloechinothrix sp. LS1_15]